jgi:hypothetical protein
MQSLESSGNLRNGSKSRGNFGKRLTQRQRGCRGAKCVRDVEIADKW